MKRVIEIPEVVTVGDLAERLDIPVTGLITELIKNGIMATVNERVDFDTAVLVLEEFMPEIELVKLEKKVDAPEKREKKKLSKQATERPPVVAVMGHVDHGKTSLLDAIRQSDVVEGEAGGITQHISAYQVTHNKKLITFLDTPGHEAFAALRQHGANLTDMAIIVVAADDGVKPQTKEAVRFASQAGVKVVVAINKIDKTAADVNRVKQELANENLLVEDWGGDIVAIEVSAKTKQGITEMLDMIILMAEMEELKAETDCPAEGLIIESHMEPGKGAMATALIEHGILKPRQVISAGGSYARIRTMCNTARESIEEAGPSTPVVLTGFKTLPKFGDLFKVHKSEKEARQAASKHEQESATEQSGGLNMTSTEMIRRIDKKREQKEIPVILRADVQGSLTSVIQAIQGLEHDEVKIRVIGSGVGPITENDIGLADVVDAKVYGFSVELPVALKKNASRTGVSVKIYDVIYELLDDIKSEMSELLEPEVIEEEVGRLLVKGVFRTTKEQLVCGGEVTKGKVIPGVLVKISRDGEELGEAEITSVQKGQTETKEVIKGEMCGVELKTSAKINLKEGDRIDLFTREFKARKIE